MIVHGNEWSLFIGQYIFPLLLLSSRGWHSSCCRNHFYVSNKTQCGQDSNSTPFRKQNKLIITLILSLKKVKGSQFKCLCLYQRLSLRFSLTTETIWFSFKIKLISPGKVYNYIVGRYHHSLKRITSIKNCQIKMGCRIQPSTLNCP